MMTVRSDQNLNLQQNPRSITEILGTTTLLSVRVDQLAMVFSHFLKVSLSCFLHFLFAFSQPFYFIVGSILTLRLCEIAPVSGGPSLQVD